MCQAEARYTERSDSAFLEHCGRFGPQPCTNGNFLEGV